MKKLLMRSPWRRGVTSEPLRDPTSVIRLPFRRVARVWRVSPVVHARRAGVRCYRSTVRVYRARGAGVTLRPFSHVYSTLPQRPGTPEAPRAQNVPPRPADVAPASEYVPFTQTLHESSDSS